MNDRLLDRIPDHLQGAVSAALSAAFGAVPVETHQPRTGGASGTLALRVTVKGRQYVLRVEARRSPLRNPHQYTCMRIAAEAGVAPPLHYADAEAGVAIVDYIVAQPMKPHCSRELAALVCQPCSLREVDAKDRNPCHVISSPLYPMRRSAAVTAFSDIG